MSSFSNPHALYLFEMSTGKKKLAYGQSPADALVILGYRLPPEEMQLILKDQYIKINQRQLPDYVDRLG